ncbi:MAG: hypothetical protein ACFE85_03145 [Candidatus Hodarchaeota archaeon]
MIFDADFHMMDWLISIFGPYSWLIMVLGMGGYIITSVIIAYYVHKDAVRRGIVNSEIWLIMSLIFNVLGLLLYLLVRGNYQQSQSNIKVKENRT